jgi:hypothetical protein
MPYIWDGGTTTAYRDSLFLSEKFLQFGAIWAMFSFSNLKIHINYAVKQNKNIWYAIYVLLSFISCTDYTYIVGELILSFDNIYYGAYMLS